jgi:hypothetical protein
MKLFTLDSGNIRINVTEVLIIKEFEGLLLRDTSIGKLRAYNEFKFIYHLADPLSRPNQDGFNETQAIEFACKECDFPKDYKPDKLVEAALVKYADLRSSVIAEVCEELLISFRTSSTVLKKIRARIDVLLSQPEVTEDSIKNIIGLQKQIMEMGSSIPDNIKKIVVAQKELEATNKVLGRGKIEITDSMDPKRALG